MKKRETRMQYLQVTGHVVNGLILADGWANEWLLCQREVSVVRWLSARLAHVGRSRCAVGIVGIALRGERHIVHVSFHPLHFP